MCKDLAMTQHSWHGVRTVVVVLAPDTAIAFELGLPHRFLRGERARPRLARTASRERPRPTTCVS